MSDNATKPQKYKITLYRLGRQQMLIFDTLDDARRAAQEIFDATRIAVGIEVEPVTKPN